MEPRIHYCTTGDGVRIAYWRIGQGEPLIVTPINAYSHIGLEWRNEANRSVYQRLATRRALVRYDGRGAGLSQRDAVDFSIEARVADLAAVIRAQGETRVAILGLGNNGPAAVCLAAENPSRVSHLVLYDSYISKGEAVDELSGTASEALADALSERDLGYLGRTWAAIMGADPEWYASYIRAAISPDAFQKLIQHVRGGGQSCSAWVSKVRCPCLVVHEHGPAKIRSSQRSWQLRFRTRNWK